MSATLAQTTFFTRTFIKYGIAFIVFLFVARVLWGVGIKVYQHYFPPPPTPPTVLFDKLPTLPLPKNQEGAKPPGFSLELPEGDLPKLPATIPVYVIPKRSAYLGALDEARKISSSLGFSQNEQSVSTSTYRWKHDREDITLEMNIITQAFSISSELYNDNELLAQRAPNQNTAVSHAQTFLSRATLLPKDFKDGRASTTLIKNESGNLTVAQSLSDAQFTKVDFFRQNYNDFPLVTSSPDHANVWLMVSGTTNPAKNIIAGEYHYFPIDGSQSSTYPIKTSQVAWEELQGGKGAFISPPQDSSVTIRRVYLAYFDPADYHPFLQPVYVFEGDNNFTGFVPAVENDYYGG